MTAKLTTPIPRLDPSFLFTRHHRRAAWKSLAFLLLLAAAGLFLAHQIPAHYEINLAEAQSGETLNNFYEVEQGEEGRFRWTRPIVQLQLRPLDSSLHLCLEISHILPLDQQVQLTLNPKEGVASAPFQTFQLENGLHQYCADTGRLAAFLPGTYSIYKDGFLNNIWFGPTLEIRTSPSYQPPKDRRELGIVITKLEIATAAGAGRLGWPTLLEMVVTLLVVGGSFWLLQSLWWPAWAIFGGSLLPLTGWLALVAFDRVGLSNKIELALYLTLATLLALLAGRYATPQLLPDLRNALGVVRKGHLIFSPFEKGKGKMLISIRWQGGLAISLIGTVLVIMALNIILPLLPLPDEWNWGLKRFAGAPVRLAVSLLVGLMIIGAGIYRPRFLNLQKSVGLRALSTKIRSLGVKVNPYWWFLLLGLITPLIFYLLRTRDSYGDGSELVSKLKLFLEYQKETGHTNFLIWREREPLDFALHFVVWRALLRFDWWKPEYTYVFTSVLAGGVFVMVGSQVAITLTRRLVGRALIAGLLFSSGTMLLFFGYTESYTLPTLAALIYLWLGFLALKGKASLVWSAAVLTIAVMLHPQTIFLGPSFIVLLLWRAGFFSKAKIEWRQLRNDIGLALLVGSSCIAAFGLLFCMYNYSWQEWGVASQQFGGADNGAFKPLLAGAVRPNSREIYPIVSVGFLAYQFNLQMLIAPLSLALIAIVSSWALRLCRPAKEWWIVAAGVGIFFLGLTWVGARAVLWLVALGIGVQLAGLWQLRLAIGRLEPMSLFLGTAALYTWLFSVAWNPDLGAFDWDLLSLNSIFTSLLAGYLITRVLGSHPRFAQVVGIILAVAFSLQAGWILYNAFAASL